jgi:predicted RNA binding protein YcfA (HicA-like mRNA interferase family)
MPGAIPAVPGAKVVRALERAKFTVTGVSGSRHVMRHPDGRTVVVPVHAGILGDGGLVAAVGAASRGLRGIPFPEQPSTGKEVSISEVRLPRAVGPQQTEDLADLDVKVEPVDRREVRPRIYLGQVLGMDDGGWLAFGAVGGARRRWCGAHRRLPDPGFPRERHL